MEIKKWCRGREIGRGSCAIVSGATNSATGEVFAVKSVPMSRAEVIKREESIISALNSPFVISYLGSDTSKDPYTDELCYNLFMEYAPGGSLSDKINTQHGCSKEFFVRLKTFEILSGLEYLHNMGMVHCDIKGQNVLIGSDGRAKIADFGCAKFEFCEDSSSQMRGTPMYMAPEVARGEKQEASADIWALGCTVFEMVTGGAPWVGFSDPLSVLQHIGYSSDMPVIPNCISHGAKDFLSRCLIREPEKRWSAEQLIKHPFVATQENSVSEKINFATESWNTPKSILDQGMWESLTHSLESELHERIGRLASGFTAGPTWSDDDEDWITVRCKCDDGDDDALVADAPTTSGGKDGEVNWVGSRMETEELQFMKPHAYGDFLGGKNINFMEGDNSYKRRKLWIDEERDVNRNLGSELRIMIG